MDYEIIDATRPRLQLHVAPTGGSHLEERSLNRVHVGMCLGIGLLIIGFGSTLVGTLQFLAVWFGLSLVLGPFAPSLLTGGDCRVGVGELLLPENDPEDSVEHVGPRSHQSGEKHGPRKSEVLREEVANGASLRSIGNEQQHDNSGLKVVTQKAPSDGEEQEWIPEEVELLKKLVVRHPRGTLRRWEVISEALGGKHNADSVVKMSKILGQKKVEDRDAYSRFLAQRKGAQTVAVSPLSQRDGGDLSNGTASEEDTVSSETAPTDYEEAVKGRWTEVEDKALLTALRTFPKDSPARWDKVALAIPSRTKAQCLRRFSDLRKNFRNSIVGGSSNVETVVE